jgi:hypothetical protein
MRLLGAWALVSLLSAGAASADVVIDWNNHALDAIRVDRTAPPKAGRALAMAHVAVFDAVNAIAGRPFTPYAPGIQVGGEGWPPPAGGSPEAAAAAAAHRVLSHLFPAQQAALDTKLAASLAAIADGPAETDGVTYGQFVADLIIAIRTNDHSGDVVEVEYPGGSSWWAPTPPAFAPALLPNWPQVKPWALRSGSHLRPEAPPPPNSAAHATAYNEVALLGSKTSTLRTAEQTQVALFWADGGGTATPPGHWHLIAQGISSDRHLSLLENARLFALLGIAAADAAIVAWDTKYAYSCWRPVTGIRAGDQDGNPDTRVDPAWEPLIATPPFPAYTSGHSTFSASSARVLERFFGTDAISFSTASDGLPGVTRSFSSLSAAAEEAGQSRIYGGIHWQFDNQAGLASGRALGDIVFFNFLTPASSPGTCAPGPTRLCLNDGRFEVQASWNTGTSSGPAAVASQTGDSGQFYFFDADNTELTVKALKACDYNGRYWVFASGLTNVEVLIRVTDTETGRVRQYFNPRGKAFAPVQDTDAFATCP